jgi:hypothetical protein
VVTAQPSGGSNTTARQLPPAVIATAIPVTTEALPSLVVPHLVGTMAAPAAVAVAALPTDTTETDATIPFQDKTHRVRTTKGRFKLLQEVPDPAAVVPPGGPSDARTVVRSSSSGSVTQQQQAAPRTIRKGRFFLTTVQDPNMISAASQPVAILVPTSPTSAAQAGTVHAPGHQPLSAVVVSSASMVPQQVMYTTATPPPDGLPPNSLSPTDRSQSPMRTVAPPVGAAGGGGPTTIATEGSPYESQRDRSRAASEPRPRNPAAAPRKANGEKGLGRVFYLLEQMKQEITEADKGSKGLQSDMKFMVRKYSRRSPLLVGRKERISTCAVSIHSERKIRN